MTKEERKKMNLRRSPSYHGVLSYFKSTKKKVIKKYNKTYHEFIHTRSSSRAPLRAPCMSMNAHEESVVDEFEQVEQSHQQQQKVAEILKQSEGLSREELAAEIVRQLYVPQTPNVPQTPQFELPFKHPMASASPDSADPLPALTPGHFSCSRPLQSVTNRRIHQR
eukprot:UN02073